MIDIHSHILPGVDDGSQTMEASLQMARIASDSGVHTMAATPHCNPEGIYDTYYNEKLEEQLLTFQAALKNENIPLRILPGMEVYGTEEVPKLLKDGKIITLNFSKYLLLEFGFSGDLSLADFLISELLSLGICPMIAHPERYPYVQRRPGIVNDWIRKGCLIQVNKDSILGSFGYSSKKTAKLLLDCNLVSVIAGDSHGTRSRTPDMAEVFYYIKGNYSEDYANILMEENPGAVVDDRELIDRKKMEGYRRVI